MHTTRSLTTRKPGQLPVAPHGSTHLFTATPNPWWVRYRRSVMALDAAVVAVTMVVANVARFAGADSMSVVGLGTITYPVISLVLGVAWILLLLNARAYSPHVMGFGDQEYRSVVRATFFLFGGLSMVAVLLQFDVARGYLAIALPLGLVLLLVGRWSMRQVLMRARARGTMMDNALLVGSEGAVRWTAERIARTPGSRYRVHSVASRSREDLPAITLDDGTVLPNVGDAEDTVEHLIRTGLRTVILADDAHADRKFLRRLSWHLEDTPVNLVLASRLTDVAGQRIHWHPVEGLPLMTVDTPQYSGFKYVLKRGFDLLVAAVITVLVGPMALLAALAIKIEDGGPILYRQQRVGINGEFFTMTKFRSMRVNADRQKGLLADANEGAGPLFKMTADPRVTRVGRVIRRFSIDEIPQLLDVLRGDMSLVGPRPQLPEEVAQLAPHQRRRLKVKPGITGPWQVGGRSNLPADESVRLDLTYVENWSLTGDLIILAKTVKAVLARDGAY